MSDYEEENTEESEEEQVAEAAAISAAKASSYDNSSSIIRKNDNNVETVPLWLITFTDVMALMLTFFVLLYSMSVPQEEKWDEISTALSSKFSRLESKSYNSGSQDAVPIDKIDKSRALDLGYLKVIVTNIIDENKIDGVLVFQNDNRLIVSLPSNLLFKSGSAEVNLEGKKALFALGGALSRVKNRIEVVGHTDPQPITSTSGLYKTNWELSLARSTSVASILNDVGYTRSMVVRGVSSARFEELSDDVPEQERYNLSRRVDIVLMNDDGLHTRFFKMK